MCHPSCLKEFLSMLQLAKGSENQLLVTELLAVVACKF